MPKTKSSSSSASSTTSTRLYFVVLFIISLLFIYWFYSSTSSSRQVLANVSRLAQSSLFTYMNISAQVHLSESQGVLSMYIEGREMNEHVMNKFSLRVSLSSPSLSFAGR